MFYDTLCPDNHTDYWTLWYFATGLKLSEQSGYMKGKSHGAPLLSPATVRHGFLYVPSTVLWNTLSNKKSLDPVFSRNNFLTVKNGSSLNALFKSFSVYKNCNLICIFRRPRFIEGKL